MVSPAHPIERRGQVGTFTVVAWLLWTLIPALAWGTVDGMTLYEIAQPEDGGPGGAIGVAILGILLTIVLAPVAATLQWRILRRTWPNVVWLWPAWFLSIIVCLVTAFVFLPRKEPMELVAVIGLEPAIVLGLASAKPLRLSDGVPPRLSPSGIIASQRLSFRPGFLGRGLIGRYPPSPVPVQRSTSRPGHSAGRLMPKPPGNGVYGPVRGHRPRSAAGEYPQPSASLLSEIDWPACNCSGDHCQGFYPYFLRLRGAALAGRITCFHRLQRLSQLGFWIPIAKRARAQIRSRRHQVKAKSPVQETAKPPENGKSIFQACAHKADDA